MPYGALLALYPLDLLELGSAECQRWARNRARVEEISQLGGNGSGRPRRRATCAEARLRGQLLRRLRSISRRKQGPLRSRRRALNSQACASSPTNSSTGRSTARFACHRSQVMAVVERRLFGKLERIASMTALSRLLTSMVGFPAASPPQLAVCNRGSTLSRSRSTCSGIHRESVVSSLDLARIALLLCSFAAQVGLDQ